MRILKYIAIFTCASLSLLVIAGFGMWCWLDQNPKSIPYLSYKSSYGAEHILTIDSVTLQKIRAHSFGLSAKVKVIGKQSEKPLLTIGRLYITLDVFKLFRASETPIHVQVADMVLDADQLSEDLYLQDHVNLESAFDIFKYPQDFVEHLHNKIWNIQVINATIIKEKCIYKFEHSRTNENNFLKNTLTITEGKNVATALISSANSKKHSALIIKTSALPVYLFANLIPKLYAPLIFQDANKHLTVNAEVNFATNKKKADPTLRVNIESEDLSSSNDIQKFVLSIDNKDAPHLLEVRKAHLTLNNNQGDFEAKGGISHKHGLISKNSSLHLTFKAQNVNLKSLKRLWPGGLKSNVRQWLVDGMTEGVIKNAGGNLLVQRLDDLGKKDFSAHLAFDGVRLKYDPDFQEIQGAAGEADFDLSRVNIKINTAQMGSSHIYNSSVIVLYADPSIPLIIKASAEGQARDFLHFMGKSSLDKLRDHNLSIQNTRGVIKAQVDIRIPLDEEVTLDKISLNALGHISDLDINWSKIIKAQKGDLDIKISNKNVSLAGEVFFNNKPARLESLISLGYDKLSNNKFTLNSVIEGGSEVEVLGSKIFVEAGKVPVSFIYTDKNDLEKIAIHADLKNAKFTIRDLGIVRNQGSNSGFVLELSKTSKDLNWKSDQCSFTSDNFRFLADLELSPAFSLVKLHSHTTDDQTDIGFEVASTANKMDVKIRGKGIDFNKILLSNLFRSYKSSRATKADQKTNPKSLFLSVQIDKAIMKNNVMFYDILGNFECHKSGCRNSGLFLKMNHDEAVKITLSSVDNEDHWTFSATDAALFLKSFDIYNEIEGGFLSAEMSNIRSKQLEEETFIVHMQIDNFYAIKTNLIGRLLLASPFTVLSSILKTKTLMSFENLNMNFAVSPFSGAIKLNKAFAKGNLLTITAEGDINTNTDQVNIKGIIVPRFYINEITKALSKDEQSKGLIFTPYTVSGPASKPSIRVNAIEGILQSVLSAFPRLFLNF